MYFKVICRYNAILYKELEHPLILVSLRVLEAIAHGLMDCTSLKLWSTACWASYIPKVENDWKVTFFPVASLEYHPDLHSFLALGKY